MTMVAMAVAEDKDAKMDATSGRICRAENIVYEVPSKHIETNGNCMQLLCVLFTFNWLGSLFVSTTWHVP